MLNLIGFLIVLRVLNGELTPDQVAQRIELNETSFVVYNESSTKCRLDCANGEMMAKGDFGGFEKVWLVNGSDVFPASDKTFIDNNKTLQFEQLCPEDSGIYECCVRSTDMAYQSYVCYSTLLTVVDELPMDEINATEAPMPESWNVAVVEGGYLNCQPDMNYFIRVFENNATEITCTLNGMNAESKTGNNFPEPINNDLLISGFNITVHSGLYVCNGTVTMDNVTDTESVSFTVSESWDMNAGAVLLENKLVREALLNSSSSVTFTISLIMMLTKALY